MQSNVQPDSLVSDVSAFDYAAVPISVAKFLKGQATRIRQYTGKTIVQIGRDLVSAKHYLSHGQFLRWVESEVGIPPRTAQAYMQAAQWASDNRATAALLPPSLLYILSSPSTPKDFAEDIGRRVEAGEHLSPAAVRAELKAIRSAKRTNHIDEFTTDYPATLETADTDCTLGHVETALGEVVVILANSLSTAEFTRISAILMSSDVLDQPDLPGNIRRAFSCVQQLTNTPTSGSLKMLLSEKRSAAPTELTRVG